MARKKKGFDAKQAWEQLCEFGRKNREYYWEASGIAEDILRERPNPMPEAPLCSTWSLLAEARRRYPDKETWLAEGGLTELLESCVADGVETQDLLWFLLLRPFELPSAIRDEMTHEEERRLNALYQEHTSPIVVFDRTLELTDHIYCLTHAIRLNVPDRKIAAALGVPVNYVWVFREVIEAVAGDRLVKVAAKPLRIRGDG